MNDRKLKDNLIAKRLTFFGRPLSAGQKVSVGLCVSVANKKKVRVHLRGACRGEAQAKTGPQSSSPRASSQSIFSGCRPTTAKLRRWPIRMACLSLKMRPNHSAPKSREKKHALSAILPAPRFFRPNPWAAMATAACVSPMMSGWLRLWGL